MFLSSARQIRSSGDGHRSAPNNAVTAFGGRHEDFVLQIAVQQAGVSSEAQHFQGLGQCSAQWLFARHGAHRRPSPPNRRMNLSHHFKPLIVRHKNPQGIESSIFEQ
jgi:hypothetical protein